MSPSILELLPPFLAVLGILFRWMVGGLSPDTGMDLLIHALFWMALGTWFLARARGEGAVFRFTGLEFAILAIMAAALLSVRRASFLLPALQQALALLSFGLLYVVAVQALGPALLVRLLFSTIFATAVYSLWQYFVEYPASLEHLRSLPPDLQSEEILRRVQGREVFATFGGPNQLAGFLGLVLPVLAGAMLDGRSGGLRFLWPRGVALGLGLVALALTGSTGGWVAFGAAAGTFAGLAATRERRRTLFLAGAVAAGLLLIPLLPALSARNHSMHVRSVYWEAGRKVAAEAPLLGVGLDNFQEHYFRVKSDVPQETYRVHNDYLQVLADLGAIGLLAFAALLGLGLRHALARAAPSPAPDPRLPGWLVPVAAATTLLWPMAHDPSLWVFGAAGLGSWLLFRPRDASGPAPWTRIGGAAGLAGLMVHMTVEFDLYVPGVGMALFLALALAALLRGAATEVRLSRTVCAAAAGILLLVGGILLGWLAPRALAADAELQLARTAADPEERLRRIESARTNNPLNPELHILWAGTQMSRWERLSPKGTDEARTLEWTLLQAIDDAIRLRPNASPYHWEAAETLRRFHRAYRSLGESQRTSAQAYLQQALEHQRRALELYPTIWQNPYTMGRLLDLEGRDEEARPHYREALRLSDRAARETWAVRRLQLPPPARLRCEARLGLAAEARGTAAAILRPLEPSTVEELRRVRANLDLLRIPPDELDEVTRPVLEAAIDAMIQALSR